MPSRILAIAARHLKNPARVTIAREKTAAGKMPRVRQVAYVVARAHKPATLARILDMEDPVATLVFCRTRMEVESLVETFNAHGHRSEALHGGMEQRQRDKVMALFRSRKADVLIATDVAARGLDIEHLSHVVNYDVPASPEAYLHRIGRTGRAGRGGTAITLAEPREHRLLRAIESFARAKIDVGTVPTVADLRARQLDLTRASLRERLVAGNLDQVRVVVESLSAEFDLVDIAAAAVSMAHAAVTGDGDDKEIPALAIAPAPERAGKAGKAGRAGKGWTGTAGWEGGPKGKHHDRRPRLVKHEKGRQPGRVEEEGPMARLFLGAGRKAGIRPGDLVGAITGEAGLTSRSVGAIEIADSFSLVDVPESLADNIIAALKATTIRGKKVPVRRDRGHS
jgi:ATP-dependent RNA helicase DeaD